MRANGFADIDARDFRAFELLETPIYIYSFSTQRIAWANEPGLRFWNAASLAEMRDRVLTPFSQSTGLRLKDYQAAFRRGEQRRESWTIYPKGLAASAIARCTGVRLEAHDEAMLVEIQSFGPAAMPDAEVRAIEALRHTPVMVSMIAEDGAILLRNPAAAEFFSRSQGSGSDRIGTLREIFADPADFDWLQGEVRQSGHASLTVRTVEATSPFHSIHLTRISDPATGAPATLWVQQDVSQLRDVTLQLAASEATLDIVLGLSAAPSLLLSAANGRLLKANFAARKALAVEADKGTGAPAIFADTAAGQRFFAAVHAEESCTQTAILLANGGHTFWATVLGTRLTFEGDEAVLLIISDVDELHKVAAELEVALNLERGVSEMQRRMLEIASHEFRTPLAVIDGAAQRIARRSRKITPEQLEDLAGRIRGFVSALNSLLDKTIERARRNLAGVHCERAPGHLQQVIVEVCSSFAYKADIAVDPHVSALPKVWFDRILFEQALVNLIENAIKYSSGKRSPGRTRIHISAGIGPDVLELYLRDWGIGIPREDRDHVFAERTRGSNVGQRPGSGLGLFIVRGIFRAHGGDVTVVDTSGPGATIKIVLPLDPPVGQEEM